MGFSDDWKGFAGTRIDAIYDEQILDNPDYQEAQRVVGEKRQATLDLVLEDKFVVEDFHQAIESIHSIAERIIYVQGVIDGIKLGINSGE